MIYLAFFSIIMGIWSISDNGIAAFLIEKRAALSFISYAALAVVGFPLVMFVHCYLQPEDKYVHKIILGFNVIDIVTVFSLQLLGIRDMKQTVTLTHVAMLLSCLYLPFSILHMLRKHITNRRFWVTVCSFCSMFFPLAYSMYCYYLGSSRVDSYGNIMIFVFIAIFAVDVSHTIIKDIDEGKKNAIYQELALMDMLTGCYNRNSYRNDTSNWKNLNGVLLLTCDLNNLKQCNDTLGHAFGDKYITDSAAMLKKIFSQHGKVYRIGGDEFCIIIPDSSKCDIETLLASLTEEERIYNDASDVINIQIACGYAEYDAETDSDIEDIRNRADELMYKNKKEIKDSFGGKNKANIKSFPSKYVSGLKC
jgi:diguanylate cyclase (GGDEF)-like protein